MNNGSRRGKRNAALGFLLVTAVVIGGMAWATRSALRLERIEQQSTVTRELNSRLAVAIKELDKLVYQHIAAEQGRSYREYSQYFNPSGSYYVFKEGDELEQLPPDGCWQESPVADGPQCKWIGLYFQVDPSRGRWTSPQIPTLPSALTVRGAGPMDLRRLQPLWDALARVEDSLPLAELSRRIELPDRVARRESSGEDPAGSVPPGGTHSGLRQTIADGSVQGRQANTRLAAARPPSVWATQHERTKVEQQLSALNRAACDPVEQVEANFGGQFVGKPQVTDASSASDTLEVVYGVFQPLWYSVPSGEDALVLVRRVDAGPKDSYYQGFTVLWDKLKPELLAQIQDVFPNADLVPIKDEAVSIPERDMKTLPLRLEPGEQPTVTTAAVWNKLRLTLLMSWTAAIGVLIAAGVGFRNLVALTERRLQFAYAVTHELRTPLTTFQLYSDMLAAGLVPEESKQMYVETLNKESKRLSDLVEGVLEYARLENHKASLHPSATDGPSLMRTLADQIEERCKRHGVRLVTQNAIYNGQPIRTDVELVKQVTGVLVNNACRHARDSKDPQVVVRLGLDAGKLSLDVIDTGPGIDRSDARKVFRPFRRGRNAEAKAQSGIGLGLALARGWAKLLGGHLELAARNHHELGGAHFRLTIPQRVEG